MTRRTPLLAALVLTATLAYAQEAPVPADGAPAPSVETRQDAAASRDAIIVRRKILVVFENSAPIAADEAAFWKAALVSSAANARNDLMVVEFDGQAATPELLQQASRDLACTGYVFASTRPVPGDTGQVEVALSAADMLSRNPAWSSKTTKPLPRLRDLAVWFWDDQLIPALQTFGSITLEKTFTIEGNPNTLVKGLPGGPHKLDAQGRLSLNLPIPSSFSIRLEETGYLIQQDTIFIRQEGTLLPSKRQSLWSFGADYIIYNSQFPGLQFSWYPVAGSTFFRLGLVQYFFGTAFIYQTDSPIRSPLIVSQPLFGLSGQFGIYLNRPEDPVRFYISQGAIAHFTWTSAGLASEALSPWQLFWLLGAEYSPYLKQRFFVELRPTLYFVSDMDLFSEATLDSRGVLRINLSYGYIEPFYFTLGLRLNL